MQQKTGEDFNADMAPADGIETLNQPMNILELFDGKVFPASKMELISYAQDQGASEDALDSLQAMPDDIYNSLSDLNRHLNEIEMVEDRNGDLWGSARSKDLSDDNDRHLADIKGQGKL